MKRRLWLGAGALVLVLGVGLGVRRCDFTLAPPTAFSYGGHERPRVFVSHHPLIPAPGSDLTLRLVPDLPSGVTVQRATAFLNDGAGGASQSQQCAGAPDGAFACRFTLPSSGGMMVYRGRLDLSAGDPVFSRASYRFTVTAAPATDAPVEVRAPVKTTRGLADTFRVDIAWARDPSNYAADAFVQDIEQNLFDGLLADPTYRWRDDQLGFFVYMRPAVVSSYYSGRNTRCGQNPWPQDAALPPALADIEVIGVLHRRPSTAQGIEGRVTGTPDAAVFRDCAGRAARRPTVRTFSATTGIAESPLIAKHEFGHAAFGLGDEYTESDATRRAVPASPLPPSGCCCAEADSTGVGTTGAAGTTETTVTPGGGTPVTPGGGTPVGRGTKRCLAPDGTTTRGPITALDPSLSTCNATGSTLGPDCGTEPDGGCPSLAGDCVSATHWLAGTAPSGADTARPNVFASEHACHDALPRASAHPGVEDPARSLGTCHQLCGPATQACPCGAQEFWIADLNPGASVPPPDTTDVMASITIGPELHGGTCIWCVETSLCVRWHRALGDDAQKAWDACRAPPKAATGSERLWRALVRFIADLLAQILNLFTL